MSTHIDWWTGQYPILAYTTWRDLNQSQPHISIRGITKWNSDTWPSQNVLNSKVIERMSKFICPNWQRFKCLGINSRLATLSYWHRFDCDWYDWIAFSDSNENSNNNEKHLESANFCRDLRDSIHFGYVVIRISGAALSWPTKWLDEIADFQQLCNDLAQFM